MAVRVLEDVKVYYSPDSQMWELRRGQVVDGLVGVYLATHLSSGVEVLDAPTAASEPEPLHDPPAETGDPDVTPPPVDPGPSVFDPAAHTVAQVLAYVKDHPDEKAAVKAAEAAEDGKRRTVVLSL